MPRAAIMAVTWRARFLWCITCPSLQRQPGTGFYRIIFREKFHTGSIRVPQGEHPYVSSPSLQPYDRDALNVTISVNVKKQVPPAGIAFPTIKAVENEQQPDGADAVHLLLQLVPSTFELGPWQCAMKVDTKNVAAVVLHGRRHDWPTSKPS